MTAWLRALSIYQLITLSFVAVVVPLGLALGISLVGVDELAALSRFRVFDTQKLTMQARLVADLLPDVERDALQYRLLRDIGTHDAYVAKRAAFLDALTRIDELEHHRQLHKVIESIRAIESRGNALLADESDRAQDQTVVLFTSMYDPVDQLLAEANRIVAVEANQVPVDAEHLQKRLLWQVGALLPLTLIVGGWLFWVVSRPLRRVQEAIGRLGRGEFDSPVRIEGPKDIEELGRRLDWLRNRLVELEAQKGAFLRNISHELKTPLTSIREGAELLREDYVFNGTADQRKIVQILRDNSVRLQVLIDNLLHFSKKDWQASTQPLEPMRLDAIVERVLSDHWLELTKKDIKVDKRWVPVTVDGNEEQLAAIVDNLLSNAIKFSPVGGTIGIALRPLGGTACVDVTDEGPGIEPNERERVFELFFQGTRVPHSMVKGTGMGLAITREYVALHRGRIGVVDTANGAHLRVELPLAQ